MLSTPDAMALAAQNVFISLGVPIVAKGRIKPMGDWICGFSFLLYFDAVGWVQEVHIIMTYENLCHLS